MKTIMIFDRPFTSNFTKEYKMFGNEYNIIYISDFKYRDDVGLIKRKYKYLKDINQVSKDLFINYMEISMRCRYLRHLKPEESKRLINSVWLAIHEIFEEYKVDFFIGLPMDNYILDLIDLYCERNNIISINPVQSFLPNLTRITRRGEYINVRTPNEQEITEYLNLLLNKQFRPLWLSKHRTKKDLMKLYLRERGKKILFESMKVIKSDPYSFHYNCIYPMPGAITVKSINLLGIRDLFLTDKNILEQKIHKYKRAVFLPLQFSPESSLDYNIQDSRFSEYGKLIKNIIDNLPDDTLLIIKEHPDIYGYREKEFYNLFLGKENVVLVDVNITVQELFEYCSFVLVTGAASTGAEALVKGKTVISLGGAFYEEKGFIHEINDFDKVKNWPEYLVDIKNNNQQLRQFIYRIISNCLLGPYDFVRTKEANITITKDNIRNIIDYLNGVLSQK